MKSIYLHIISRDEILRVDITKIVYIEANGNYTYIILANQLKGVINMNLSQVQQLIASRLKENAGIFIRIGKKYIINHTYLLKVNVPAQKLTLSDGATFAFQLSISKSALRAFKDFYVNSLNRAQQ